MKRSFANSEISIWPIQLNSLFVWVRNNGYLLAILAALTASAKAVIVKLVYAEAEIDAITLQTLRLLIALPFFIWLAIPLRRKRDRSPTGITDDNFKDSIRNLLMVIWLGFCGYYFASWTDFVGLTYISAGLERLVLFTYPTIVLFIDIIWNRRCPSRKTIFGVVICYLGLVAAFGHDLHQQQTVSNVWRGVGWVFLSGFSFALYYLGASASIKRLGIRRLTGLAGIAAAIMTFAHFAFTNPFSVLAELSDRVWLYTALMAILCTLLPSLLMTAAIAKIGATNTANIGTLGPIITLLLAWWLLDEKISTLMAIGMTLVIIGVSRIDRNKNDLGNLKERKSNTP
ncbi:DMT family transporter [Aliikangiella coralliicola]|uniref:DMT family transporter n=1 Tax=Aliikangiella coralliicola TaxID=2592383 RepID=A0A545UFB2_9GAMM|nr:DMT family transporter [Aliikangiella coralliicola]TQV88162.1 DMT family transporter [Aliikangiella coralliicola]